MIVHRSATGKFQPAEAFHKKPIDDIREDQTEVYKAKWYEAVRMRLPGSITC
jgi:hypothetical protein